MAELKKCPFCGSGVAKIKVGSPFMWEHAIECADCGASTKVIGAFTPSSARKRAIEAWNNRPTEADIRAMALNEVLEKVKVINLWDSRDKDMFRLVVEQLKERE